VSEQSTDREERARNAEEALAQAIEERNRLWAELQRKNAVEADLEYWRKRAADLERSRWWRMGEPFRIVKKLVRDPAGMLEGRAAKIRRRRRGA
jgi:hypothetical protein